MKRLIITLKSIAFILLLSLISCGTKEWEDFEDDDIYNDYTPAQPTQPDISGIIKDNVLVSCTYSDYVCTFTVTSTVKSKLKDYDIHYGLGHLASDMSDRPEYKVSVEEQAYYYDRKVKGDTEIITFKNPIWYYYATVTENSKKAADCKMYLDALDGLKKEGYENLTTSEKQLYNELEDILDEFLNEVEDDYIQTIGVRCNNKFYRVFSYRF